MPDLIHFDVSELEELVKRFEAAPPKMEREAIQLSHDSAKRMVAFAKRNHTWKNRRGYLEKDIRVVKKGRFAPNQFGASWGVISQRRGKVGAILEARGWVFIRPATEAFKGQWIIRLVQAAVAKLGGNQ